MTHTNAYCRHKQSSPISHYTLTETSPSHTKYMAHTNTPTGDTNTITIPLSCTVQTLLTHSTTPSSHTNHIPHKHRTGETNYYHFTITSHKQCHPSWATNTQFTIASYKPFNVISRKENPAYKTHLKVTVKWERSITLHSVWHVSQTIRQMIKWKTTKQRKKKLVCCTSTLLHPSVYRY